MKIFVNNYMIFRRCYVPTAGLFVAVLVMILACVLTFYIFRYHVFGSRKCSKLRLLYNLNYR